MLKYKNVRIMLVLFALMFVYTFVLGCEDTVTTTVVIDGEEITITVKDDGEVKNADVAIEKAVEPLLDLGDGVVETFRDTEEGFLNGLFDFSTNDDDDDDDDEDRDLGFGFMGDRN